jgi:hypothetical protein
MKPIANNGTLRLPFKPVGLHDSELAPELDPAPDSSAVAEEATTPVSMEPTIQVGVDTFSITSPFSSPTLEPAPAETASEANEAQDNDGKSKSLLDSFKDGWHWFTNKVSGFIHKITGSNGE